jgi:type IV secretory pathway TrbL component
MKKLFSILIAASFATVSASAFAAAHGGAPKDADMKKMEEKMEACKKMDAKTADDKMKAECKKMMEEKKPEAMKK